MRSHHTRAKVFWAAGALGVALLVVVSGVLVGAKLVPTRPHAPQLVAPGPSAVVAAPLTSSSAPPSPTTWKQLPLASGAFVPTRLVVEKLGVSAPIEIKGIDSHNVMQSPDGPFQVAWYRFTAQPGSGSNAVFAGHRDYWGTGPAVFWHLGDLRAGDIIHVVSGQATEIRYKVAQSTNYALSSMPMQSILAASKGDEITLITCYGDFRNGGYDHRLVVTATKII